MTIPAPQKQFLEEAARTLQNVFREYVIIVSDDLKLTILEGSELRLHVNLQSTFANWQASRDTLDRLVRQVRFLLKAVRQGITWEEARTILKPVIVGPDLELPQGVVRRKLRNGLFVATVLDFELSLRYLTVADTDVWKVSHDEIPEIAVRNLAAQSQEDRLSTQVIKDSRGEPKVALVMAADDLGSSRALLPDLVSRGVRLFQGAFMVAVPCRTTLYLAAAGVVDRVRRSVREMFHTEPYGISPDFFDPDSFRIA